MPPLSGFLPSPERHGQVLVVDDMEVNHKLIARQLQGEPFDLTHAEGPAAALDLCQERIFEAILSDVTMPEMDGLAFCRQIQNTPNARTPFLFLSALQADDASVAAWMECGAFDYLARPYGHAELIAKLRVAVRLSRQQSALVAHERETALIEVAGGAAHELSQPLASAMLLLERMEGQDRPPTYEQLVQLRELLERTGSILAQIQNLSAFITKPYATGRILDIQKSHEASGEHSAVKPKRKARR